MKSPLLLLCLALSGCANAGRPFYIQSVKVKDAPPATLDEINKARVEMSGAAADVVFKAGK